MKNLFFALVSVVLFASCSSTPEQKFIKKIDKYMSTEFVKGLKDPSSFQKVDCMVFDTLTVEDYKAKYNKDAGPEFKNGIVHIKISYTYRAKQVHWMMYLLFAIVVARFIFLSE